MLYRDLSSREGGGVLPSSYACSQLLVVPGAECRHTARTAILNRSVVSSASAHGPLS